MKHLTSTVIGLCLAASTALGDSLTVTWSAMVDVAFSHSFNDPKISTKPYLTQPSRNGEVGLLLGHVAASVHGSGMRARVAVQEGWFTRANYVGADSAWRMLQEASVGLELTQCLWLDAGVMFSHIGYESMIARDNLVLSRSLTADYTPYYATGAALTWTASSDLTVSALVLNGWQQIVDVNDDVSLGTKVM